jgi:peroxin-5
LCLEQDYLLWNRLGSSLSNGNKPEEALSAYKQALQLRPTYTRAMYNVGVACKDFIAFSSPVSTEYRTGLNLGAHQQAAEHFLSTLVMQDSTGKGTKSEQVWLTLRKTFSAMVCLLVLISFTTILTLFCF